MRKIFTLVFLMLFVLMRTYGQTPIQYAFEASTGTYTELTGPTVLGTATTNNAATSLDDVNYRVTFPAGYSFSYLGTDQTALNINTNGYVGFGTVAWTSSPYDPLGTNPSGGTTSGLISAFGRDLNAYATTTPAGTISWQVIGTGTDEVFVVQYKNFKQFENSGTVDRLLNFQILLYESTHATKPNRIEFVYGNCVIADSDVTNANVGIRNGNTGWAANINNVMIGNIPAGTNCNWLNVVTGNNNTASGYFNTANNTISIPNGLVFSFIPQNGPNPVRTFDAATVTHNTATISWTAPTGATQYNVQYKTPNSCTWTNLTGNPVTGATATITGLTPETVYQYRVQASNGTLNSIWSHIPNTAGGGNGYTANGSFLTTPPPCDGTPVAGTISGTLTRYICSGSAPGVITVTGATSSIIPGIGFQWEQSVNSGTDWANAVGGTGATTTSYTPPSFAGTPIQYRLRVTCVNGGGTIVSDVLTVNNRIAPTTQATALTAAPANISLTSFGLSWTSGNGDRRQVYVSTTPITDPVDGTGVTITANAAFANTGQQLVYDGTGSSVTVTGLTCGTQYYVKVFEYNRCGSGPYNTLYLVPGATNAITVTTATPATAPALPITNNFPGLTDTNLSTIAPGWYEAVGTTNVSLVPVVGNSDWRGSTALGTPTAKVNLYDDAYNTWIISPKMAITANSRLKFKAAITDYNLGTPDAARMTGTDDKVNILVSTDGCGAVWTVIHTFDAANTTTLTNVLTDFSLPLNYAGQTIQIAFQGVDGPVDNAPDYDFHIGNIVVELVPQCDVPTALAVENITKNSAAISWNAPATGTPTGYQYVVSTTATPPAGVGTDVAGTVTSLNATPLLPATTYYVYVRTACGGDFSNWVAGPSFTTKCDYPDLTSTTPGSVCGQGIVTLQVAAPAGAEIKWFTAATGGTAVGTGASYTTPLITATTNYYVSTALPASGADVPVGAGATPLADVYSNPFYSLWSNNHTQHIITAAELQAAGLSAGNINSIALDVTAAGSLPMIDLSIKIGTTTATNMAAFVANGSFATVFTSASYMPVAGINTFTFATPFNWDGTSNIVVEFCHGNVNSGASMYRTIKGDATSYVSTIKRHFSAGTSSAAVCGATTGGTEASYSVRPQFYFNGVGLCYSPRVAVAATVTTPPVFTLSGNPAQICNGQTTTAVTITAGATDYNTYVWSPATGVTGDATTGWTFNPTASTVYTLTASQSAGTLCSTTATVAVTVKPLPPAINIAPVAGTACPQTVLALTATGGDFATTPIGTATTTTENDEELTAFNNRRITYKYQMIYTAAELLAAGVQPGNITSLTYNITTVGDGTTTTNYRMKLGTTTNAAFPNSSYINETAFVTVYGPATHTHTVGANTITFTTPFVWDGTSNIVVSVSHGGANDIDNAETYYTDLGANTTIYNFNDLAATTGTVSTKRFNARFNTIIDNPLTWSPVTNLYSDAAGTVPYVAGTNANTVYFKSGTDGAVTYTATATSAAGCTTTKDVVVTVTSTPAPEANATQTICNAGTVANLQTTSGTGVLWYADATGGTPLASTVALVDGEDYFASQTVGGCESLARTEVTVEINVTAAPTVDETTQTFCHTATVADLEANGDNIIWYSDPTAADAQLDPADALEDGTSYFASQTIDGCESATRTEVTVVITSTPAPTVDEATQTFCNTASVAGLQANGDGILWYATADGETPLAETDALVDGSVYYGSQTADGCESIERVEVTVVINVTPAPTVDNATQSFCNAATVADLDANGDSILWYASEDAETPLTETDALIDGAIYYASQTIDGCEGLERVEVTVEINVTPAPEGDAQQELIMQELEVFTFADLDVTLAEGGTITWYASEEDAIAGVNPLPADTDLESETTYYATQTVGSCTSTEVFAVTVTITLDNKEFNSAAFTYYPNPVKDVLTLAYSQDISNVTVYNMVGQPVMTQQINAVEGRINMSNLADGTYMVNVTFGNTVKTIRVIKKQ